MANNELKIIKTINEKKINLQYLILNNYDLTVYRIMTKYILNLFFINLF